MLAELLMATLPLLVSGDSMANQHGPRTEPILEQCLGVDVTYHATNGIQSTEVLVPENTNHDVLVILGTNDILKGATDSREAHRRIWRIISQVDNGHVYWQEPLVAGMMDATNVWSEALAMWERIGMLTVVPWNNPIGYLAVDDAGWDGVHVNERGAEVMAQEQCSTIRMDRRERQW